MARCGRCGHDTILDNALLGRSTICPTFDSCDVINMREMRGEVRKKTPKKRDGQSLIFMTLQESKVGQIGLRPNSIH